MSTREIYSVTTTQLKEFALAGRFVLDLTSSGYYDLPYPGQYALMYYDDSAEPYYGGAVVLLAFGNFMAVADCMAYQLEHGIRKNLEIWAVTSTLDVPFESAILEGRFDCSPYTDKASREIVEEAYSLLGLRPDWDSATYEDLDVIGLDVSCDEHTNVTLLDADTYDKLYQVYVPLSGDYVSVIVHWDGTESFPHDFQGWQPKSLDEVGWVNWIDETTIYWCALETRDAWAGKPKEHAGTYLDKDLNLIRC